MLQMQAVLADVVKTFGVSSASLFSTLVCLHKFSFFLGATRFCHVHSTKEAVCGLRFAGFDSGLKSPRGPFACS